MKKEEYLKMKLPELKTLATEKGLKTSGLKKEALIEKLLETDSAVEPTVEKTTDVLETKPAVHSEPIKKRTVRKEKTVKKVQENEPSKQPELIEKPVQKEEEKEEINSPVIPADTEITVPEIKKEVRTFPKREEIKDPASDVEGILEILEDGFGFLRQGNLVAGDGDVYVSPTFIKKFRLKTGDYIQGKKRAPRMGERYESLIFISKINFKDNSQNLNRVPFESLTPIFPNERFILERQGESLSMRIMDLVSPIGKGQRGLIVSPPKAGKTTILKDLAISILRADPKTHLIILLIDERPEEVTDIKELITGDNVKVVYSTFDEQPERHKHVSELTIEHAKRLVEAGEDVVILLDSITRLARAYNLTEAGTGRTLSGGLDPSALYMPKKFFGAARNTREKGSLTILATALVETGSKMDDVIYEEFKGTGNMELLLSRKLQERRIFPAIDIPKSGTRREDLLFTPRQLDAANVMRKCIFNYIRDDSLDRLISLFIQTKNNEELVEYLCKNRSI